MYNDFFNIELSADVDGVQRNEHAKGEASEVEKEIILAIPTDGSTDVRDIKVYMQG